MNTFTTAYFRLRWLHLPAALLMVLLQRLPMLRAIVTTEFVVSSGVGSVLKGVLAGSAALGAVQTVAGATELDAGTGGNPGSATVGVAFTGGFAVVGAPAVPASYEITGDIPPGLTVTNISGDQVNGSTVTITGTPTEAGSFAMRIRAWKGPNKTLNGGQPTFNYVINIAAGGGSAPAISNQPDTLSVATGGSASFSVSASGDPTPTFQWRKDGTNITGATSSTFSIATVAASDAGDYTVVVTNASGSDTSTAATLTVTAAATVTIGTQPVSINPVVGGTASLSVIATSSGSLSYQWFRFKRGEGLRSLSGETGASLVINPVATSDMGFYFARITGGTTTVDSAYAILTVPGGSSRLANLSTRGNVPAGGELTPGFVLRGDGTKNLVIRAVGPELADFGVSGAMADPTLGLVPLGGSTPQLTNDNWEDSSNSASLVTTSATLGAFPLDSGSLDAAVLTSVSLPNSQGSKGFTVQIKSTSGAAGIILAEVYDPDAAGTSAQLTNISARGFSGLGADVLAPGFVIDGDGAMTMLIRVVGPTLGNFGVSGTMVDPRLEVIPGGQTFVVANNDNWGGTAALKAAFATTGAFSFADDGSLDAVVVVRLPPGPYTVRPSGANDGTGVILVEAYEVID
ncbi:MAG: immunoglobulin domain-containing protein [Opitutaceae bacterium]